MLQPWWKLLHTSWTWPILYLWRQNPCPTITSLFLGWRMIQYSTLTTSPKSQQFYWSAKRSSRNSFCKMSVTEHNTARSLGGVTHGHHVIWYLLHTARLISRVPVIWNDMRHPSQTKNRIDFNRHWKRQRLNWIGNALHFVSVGYWAIECSSICPSVLRLCTVKYASMVFFFLFFMEISQTRSSGIKVGYHTVN